MSSKYKGPESQDCELYNKVLGVHQAELVYDIDAHVHKLFINENQLEPQDAIKTLRKMILSLQSLNTQNTGLTVEAKAGRDVNTVLGGIRAEGQVVIGGGNISNVTEIGNSSDVVPRKVVEVDNVAILKQLKLFFMNSKYKGSESQDCELYNSVLAIHNGDLVYDVAECAYRLFVNDELIEPQNVPKTLTKIIASLQPLNTHRTGSNTASSGNALLQAHAGRDVITITGGVTSGGEVRIGGGDMNHNLRAYNQFRDQTAGQDNMTDSENVRFDNGSLKNNKTNTWR